MQKLLIKIFVLNLLVLIFSCDRGPETSSLLSYVSNPRLSSETRIFDNAGLINDKNRLDTQLKALYNHADIDMVVLTVSGLQGNDIDVIIRMLLENWKIGENTNGRKSIVFLLSVKDELVRLKTGQDLQWIYTDSFVKNIEKEQMAQYFETGRIQPGIAATLEMIIARANEEIKGGLYESE